MTAIAMDNRFGIAMPVTQPLSPEWMKHVWAAHAHYVGDALNGVMLEQFREKMRASANCIVAFAGKSYAVVNWALKAGQEIVAEFVSGRGRGATAKGLRFTKPIIRPAAKRDPNSPGGIH